MDIQIVTPKITLPPGPPRTPGVHLSGAIKLAAVKNGSLDPQYLQHFNLIERPQDNQAWWDALPHETQCLMTMGMAWEDYYLGKMHADTIVHQPGEMFLDGLYMTPDGESLESTHIELRRKLSIVIHEVKLTYMSWNTIRDIKTQYKWMAQLMENCLAKGTLDGWLHALCVLGDYSRPYKPFARIFKIHFTQDELDENHDSLKAVVNDYLSGDY